MRILQGTWGGREIHTLRRTSLKELKKLDSKILELENPYLTIHEQPDVVSRTLAKRTSTQKGT